MFWFLLFELQYFLSNKNIQNPQAHSECLIYNITKLAMAKEKLRRERKLKERVIYSVMPSSIGSKLVKMEQTQSQFQE